MRRYFYSKKSELSIGESVKISDDLFKHIFKVCRRKMGDGFELLTESSSAYFVRVVNVGKSEAVVEVVEERIIESLPRPYVHLVLANPKPSVFERVVEKSVELGVSSLIPLVTENSFFKSSAKLKEKSKRLEKIALHAQQQTGRGTRLNISAPLTSDEFFKEVSLKEVKLWRGYVLYEAMSSSLELEDIMKEPGVDDVFIVIGGEGGFNPPEVEVFKTYGFRSISLGKQILRVETACVAGISILKSRWGLWS